MFFSILHFSYSISIEPPCIIHIIIKLYVFHLFLILTYRLSTVDSGSLLISEVQATDAGKYECSAQSMAGSKIAPSAMLKVLAPPTIVRVAQDTEVIEGDGFDLPCEVCVFVYFSFQLMSKMLRWS